MSEPWRNALKAESVSVDASTEDVAATDIEGAVEELSTEALKRTVNLAAVTQALTVHQSTQKFVGVVDAVFTLPASAPALKGAWYEFECGALSSGTGLSISPAAADGIGGNGLTSVVNKDLINAGASDRLGDMVRLYCTGATGTGAWMIEHVIGTWSKEA